MIPARLSRRVVYAAAFLGAIGIRAVLLFSFPGNPDSGAWEQVAGRVRSGDLYLETTRYSYTPVWAFFLSGADLVAKAVGCPLHLLVGLVLLIVDALTALVLFRIAREKGGGSADRAVSAALLFFLNPVSILISSFHGQIDNIAILFLLLALAYAGKERLRKVPVVACLSVSLLIKHVAWFHPLLFFRDRKRGRAGLGASVLVPYAFFFASFLPYWRSWKGMRKIVFEYRAYQGLYGTGVLTFLWGIPTWIPTTICVVVTLAAVLLLRRVEIVRASLLLFLVILIFLPGIGRQYFVWPIALGSIFGGPGYLIYTVAASGFLVGSIFELRWHLNLLPPLYAVWGAAVIWLLLEVRRLRTAAVTASPSTP